MPRRLIIEVCQGRSQGLKASIAAGHTLSVGRTDRADLVLPKDKHLSGVHFELSWNGSVGQLRSLKDGASTEVNGERVTQVELTHGSWVRAGQTYFCVYHEAHTPAPRTNRSEPEPSYLADARHQARVLLSTTAKTARLFAVLDAARTRRIPELLRESVERYRSLYEGIQGDKLAHAAPYLVRLPAGSRLLEDLVFEGWGKRWGIYLTSSRPFAEVRRHLRRFLMIDLEDKYEDKTARAYFRYYDPSVMELFWETFTVRQRQTFMREHQSMIFERELDGTPVRVEANTP